MKSTERAGDLGGSRRLRRRECGADFVQRLAPRRLAPKPGAGPATAHRSIKLRLLYRHTAPVSTALIRTPGAGWTID